MNLPRDYEPTNKVRFVSLAPAHCFSQKNGVSRKHMRGRQGWDLIVILYVLKTYLDNDQYVRAFIDTYDVTKAKSTKGKSHGEPRICTIAGSCCHW